MALTSPSTAVLCPELPSPGNGTVQLDSRRVNETATYTCDVGFVRVGPRVRECMPNGEWSNQAPTCESKFVSKLTRVRESAFIVCRTSLVMFDIPGSCFHIL